MAGVAWFLFQGDKSGILGGQAVQSGDEAGEEIIVEVNHFKNIQNNFGDVKTLEDFQAFVDEGYSLDSMYIFAAKVQDKKLWNKVWDHILTMKQADGSIVEAGNRDIKEIKSNIDQLYRKIERGEEIKPTNESTDLEVVFSTIPLQEALALCETNINVQTEIAQECKNGILFYRADAENNLCEKIPTEIDDATGTGVTINTQDLCTDAVEGLNSGE